ncbi:hypothetical protein, partial [Streptomyces albidoflavus]|uniref:hypothetical protein n=1 Tax=Streptomyces albidoflavus TaxID=1886 RepID=UPI0034800BCD
PAWPLLKEAVEELRILQQADGSVTALEATKPGRRLRPSVTGADASRHRSGARARHHPSPAGA